MNEQSNLQIKVIDSTEEFESLQSEWDELVVHTSGNVFLMHAWLSGWWRVYGDGNRLHIVTVRDSGKLVGALPLMLEKGTGGIRRLQFVGSGEVTPNHLDLIARPADEPGVMQALLEHLADIRSRWDVLELNKLLAHSNFPKSLKDFFDRRQMTTRLAPSTQCQYIALPESFDEYLKTRSYNKRRSLTRSKGKLITDYPSARFAFVRDPEELSRIMGKLIDLHQLRWRARGYPGAFATHQFRQFHYDTSSRFLKTGQLKMSYLEVDSQIIAVCYCFQIQDVVQGYLPSFDQQWAKYSPGALLKAYTIEQAIEEGAREFDFLEGEEADKIGWTTNSRSNLLCRVYASTWRGNLVREYDSMLEAVREWGVKYVPVKIRRPLWQLFLRWNATQASR